MSGYLDRPAPSGLADVIEVILDKRLVIDAYLRFAEATNRLDLEAVGGKDLPETLEALREAPAKGITSGVIAGVKDTFTRV